MTDVEKLLAIEEIKRLKARYFRFVDTKDWISFAKTFAPDAHFDISDDVPGCVLIGREAITAAASQPLQHVVSVHHGHSPEIIITSDTAATGIWAMEDMLFWSEDSPTPYQTLHGFGHYFETYEKIDAQWYVKSLKLKRLRVSLSPGRLVE